jgi:hypothetical protein
MGNKGENLAKMDKKMKELFKQYGFNKLVSQKGGKHPKMEHDTLPIKISISHNVMCGYKMNDAYRHKVEKTILKQLSLFNE